MKLREIIRPPINEDIIPQAAKQWWAKYGKTVGRGLLAVNIVMLVNDIDELLDNISRLPKEKMTKQEWTASVATQVGKLVADYGLPEVMFAIGAVTGGAATAITGPGFIAGAGIGGLMGVLAYFPVSFVYGDDLKDLVEWLVAKYYLGDEYASIRSPNPKSATPEVPVNDAAAKYAQKQAVKMGLPDTSPTAKRVMDMAKWYRAHPAEIKP
jgi:hypothetical protein